MRVAPSAFSLVPDMSSLPFLHHLRSPGPVPFVLFSLMNASRQSSRLSRLVNRLALIYSSRLFRFTPAFRLILTIAIANRFAFSHSRH